MTGVDEYQILLFGDLSSEFEGELRQLLHYRGHGALRSFFDAVGLAFRLEFATLPSEQREWLPKFSSLVDLVEGMSGTTGSTAIRAGLLCVYQIGRFILSDSYPNAGACQVMGVCMGSFAATAVAWSKTVQELIPAGVEAAIVAFRTGLKSLEMKYDLESRPEGDQASWSAVIGLSDADAQEVITKFNDELNVSPSSQLYLSAVGASTVTVSGLPGVLQRFIDSHSLKAHPIQIKTPYHAPHLYGPREVDDVMDSLRDDRLSSYSFCLPLLSTASGDAVTAASFFEALKRAVEDTLCNQVRWDKSCRGVVELLAQQPDTVQSCVITPVASHAATVLSSTLHAAKRWRVTISHALNTKPELSQDLPSSGRFRDEKIAILGYSGRFPEAASNDELWEVLVAARDCHRTIPPDRFDWEEHYDATGKKKNHTRVKYGCFINEPGLFDARFFNMSPREAENTDPAQRLAIMSAYEAMEMAGMVPDRTPSTQCDRVGVFFGTTSDDWREVNSGQDVDTYFIPGGNRAFVPGRISYFFRFSGPSVSVDTACSSSFAAIATACNALWHGDCDSALAGGTNVLTNPSNFVGLDRGHFLSIDGNCNPFDDSASGYCRADAVGVVVLKRLCDAIAEGDPIMGVIAGASTNHCGQTVSITRPHDGDQLSLFRRILQQTNTNPAEVGYVEMHGTGTQAGDATEMRSVLSAFDADNIQKEPNLKGEQSGEGEVHPQGRSDDIHLVGPADPARAGHRRRRALPLYLGAVKANVGHSESASGVTALIKVLMMMRHSAIPPHRLNGVLNRNYPVDLAERNVHIASRMTPWRRQDGVNGRRKAFLNNFSAAGGNTAVLLEDGPLPLGSHPDGPEADPRTIFPVAVSGRTIASIAANIRALADFLEQNPDTNTAALSYTTTARRIHHRFRTLAVGQNVDQIISVLRGRADDTFKSIPLEPPRIAFAFTGQGNLYTGLGQQLFQHVPSFRDDLERFDRLAVRHGFPSCLDVVAGDCSADDLDTDPVRAQLVAVCVQMALSRLWVRWQGDPSVVIGHSLGEYAALYAAGVLSASDAIYLVGHRARLLHERCTVFTHAMLAVKAPLATLQNDLPTTCEVACVNSPTSFVVAGAKEEIGRLAGTMQSLDVETVLLNVPFAFHSAQVEPILSEFEILARSVCYHPPAIPYLSPLLSRVVAEPDVLNASYLKNAARGCVDFQGAIEAARQSDVISDSTIWIELGPHPACSGMIKQTLSSGIVTVPLLRKSVDTWRVIVAALETVYQAGAEVKWNEFHRGFDSSHEVLSLPTYKWDLRNYWINYEPHSCSTEANGPAPAMPLSSSIHRVLEMNSTDNSSSLLAESDLHDPRLFPIVSGHKVNGTMLCPSSLYADMALTTARYMLQSNGRLDPGIALDCGDMKVQRPLVARPGAISQLIRLSAEADWLKGEIKMALFSVSNEASKLADHATCIVRVTEDPELARQWKSQAYLLSTRIATLGDGVALGTASKLNREMAYRLFGGFVEYSHDYQGMEQVLLDSRLLEASATVKFQIDDRGFDCNPCWIDSLGHIAGFIMNANYNPEMKDQVFVNHGWDSMRYAKPFEVGKTYTTYNRMQLEDGTLYSGDTYVFESEELIAIFKRVKFQGVPRSVLNSLLPPISLGKSAQTSGTPATGNRARKSIGQPIRAVANGNVIPEADELKNNDGDQTSRASTPYSHSHSTVTSASTSASGRDEALSEASSLDEATPPGQDIMTLIRNVLCKEIGASPEELLPDSSLNDLGVDSLLALTITGALAEIADLTLPSDLFVKNFTLGEIENALVEAGLIKKPTEIAAAPMTHKEDGSPGYEREPLTSGGALHGKPVDEPHATSVLLQGSPRTATKILFLLPDGAGSATTYQFLPTISPDVAVFGLNCPWMKTPEKLQCSLERYVTNLLVEIRHRQPHGPYHLGGASAGGILAYEAAQQLASAGEKSETLIFFDVPNPVGIQSPNDRFYEFLEHQGMFGMATSRDLSWLRPHFMAFVKMLDAYEVRPFIGPSRPATHIVYAEDGICKSDDGPRLELRPDDPREMQWLLENRTDFTGAGWNWVLGEENLHITTLGDVNHFTIMQEGPKMGEIRTFIAQALQVR